MAEYSYINIALRGTVQGATRTIFSYPGGADGADPGWNTSMVEPSAAIKRFLNASDCYVLQESEKGHFISLITRDTVQPERGWVMISLFVENGCSLSGPQVMNIFTGLKKCLIEEPDLTDEAIDVALIRAGVPRLPVKLESWSFDPARATPPADEPRLEAGYRTFISVQELESIFAFPSQPEYARFRCVLVVSATTSLRPGVKMPRITVPIRKQYTVECPEGVKASSALVYDGDRLSLTYEKEGYGPHTETVTVGQPAAYTKYEGSKILVRTALQTGIRFIRRIPVKVVSAKGGSLTGYTITVNGHSVSTMTPYIDFTERDLQPGTDVDMVIASNNYKTLKFKRPADEMLTTTELTFELHPLEQPVVLRLDFGDGRVFEQEISIEKNTPEYNRLHSGNFHGFRAHRQVTDDNSEVYNVDVRLTNPPVAPNFETGRTETDDRRPSSPKFVNVSDEAAQRRPAIDTKLPTRDTTPEPEDTATRTRIEKPVFTPEPDEDDEDDDDDITSEVPFYKRSIVRWLAIGLAAIAAVVIITLLIPEDGGHPEDAENAEALSPDSLATVVGQHVASLTPEETADIDYLNNNAAWNLDSLRSPMGIALAQAMREGDLKAVAENDYFAVNGRCRNTLANSIADMAWKAIGSPNEKGNKKHMRNIASKSGGFTLKELSDKMSTVRPSEKINDQPRPSK